MKLSYKTTKAEEVEAAAESQPGNRSPGTPSALVYTLVRNSCADLQSRLAPDSRGVYVNRKRRQAVIYYSGKPRDLPRARPKSA
jgi:hypothetical protein